MPPKKGGSTDENSTVESSYPDMLLRSDLEMLKMLARKGKMERAGDLEGTEGFISRFTHHVSSRRC